MGDPISWGLAEIVRMQAGLALDLLDWHTLLCAEWTKLRAGNLLPPYMAHASENGAKIAFAHGLATGLARGEGHG